MRKLNNLPSFRTCEGTKREDGLLHVLKDLKSGEEPRRIHRLHNVVGTMSLQSAFRLS